jgi:hypothetical protein
VPETGLAPQNPGFSCRPTPPSAKDVEKIQNNMLGPANLDAQRYPEITFKTASVTANGAESFVLSGPLTIRGVTRTVPVPVVHKGALFSGEFKVKLTDFGIKPESISGVVNVKDTIEVRLAFEGSSEAIACLRPASSDIDRLAVASDAACGPFPAANHTTLPTWVLRSTPATYGSANALGREVALCGQSLPVIRQD